MFHVMHQRNRMLQTQRVFIFCCLLILFSSHSLVSALQTFQKIPLPPQITGPEAFAFDPQGGGPYTGVSGGKILKYQGPTLGFTEFAYILPIANKSLCEKAIGTFLGNICGRPVGLAFNEKTGDLYIADAYLGLYVVSYRGGLAKRLADSAAGVPFRFLDGLDVDPVTGMVYFTSFSTRFGPSQLVLAVAVKDTSGRLFRYDPKTKTVTVLLSGLSGSAGCAVSSDGGFVLVGEFLRNRILRYWIKGPKANTFEIFVPSIPGPDNIRRTESGDFWVASNSVKLIVVPTEPSAVKISSDGEILQHMPLGEYYGDTLVSEVNEYKNVVYLGTLTTTFVGNL
ncbi:PREDICTED: protein STRICTOSIDINE SYNTHASE-LIKE 11-like isoform X2 [Camelina sativa]|uniref:Protein STRICTOSIDINE SYNTHASE-LIKE 11-like isoform X1 n=1 Tax=Camelina sativa TaxID=90675 RepID=A0ABM0TM24_CAMSA|nr:PREDICTED: protein STRICTOSIDINE SYNTHASE-LIKE 11-like isoform X1 [Camelina sativa]XP_010428360.1 PREDICTED: protein STRICTOSIDINE SYNTHASE-LIKE 11-like isoform X2 [Camelina sativa]